MNSARIALALLVVLAVVGVAVAAAGLESADAGPGDGEFGSASDAAGESTTDVTADRGYILVIRAVAGLVVVLAVAGVVAGLVYSAVDNRTLLLAGLVVVVMASALLLAPEADRNPFRDNDSSMGQPGDSTYRGIPPNATEANDTAGGDGSPRTPATLLVVFGGLVLLGVLLVAGMAGGGAEPDPDIGPEETPRTDVAEAAGRAADDLAERDLSNVVYRAWRDMTTALDVGDPVTTTPAEFADAAVAAGLAEADVRTLTDLFREVRYGDEPVTEARERRARETLRRIEETYADGSGADEGGGDA